MKTTRTILVASAAVLALAAFAVLLVNVTVPVAALFEYATGTLVTTGLFTMLLGSDRTPPRVPEAPSANNPAARSHRRATRHSLVHAL